MPFKRKEIIMKNVFKKLTCLVLPFMILGCSHVASESKPAESSVPASKASSQSSKQSEPAKSSSNKPSSEPHVHTWSEEWDSDGTTHWHPCTDPTCTAKSGIEAHTKGEVGFYNPVNTGLAKFPNPKKGSVCSVCGSFTPADNEIIPKLTFTFDKNDPNANFATVATKSDLSRPEVMGKLSISNCDSAYVKNNLDCGLKVRGNQTAGWSKKGFRIKLTGKSNLLGLNEGQKFKKWVLLADAKDTCIIRTALGLYLSKITVKEGDNVWYSDFCPVSVYLNDQYWGFYYLAEQKEVKSGRVMLPENDSDSGYTGIDIGYCFELDHYADAQQADEASEVKKGADGDPTFKISYKPQMIRGNVQGSLAAGGIDTYTMLSEISDGPSDVHTDHTNSNQVAFIRNKLQALYTVLYEAAVNKKAKEINDAGEVVNSSKTVKEVVEQYFDLKAWADGIIINGFCCPPDLGYSSFYMSYDNSPTGDKRLRFDVPWDFDSNFGNRNGFITNGDENTYVDRTHNMWIQLFSKIDFFMNDYVKARWNLIREEKGFEEFFVLMKTYFNDYDLEIQKNHKKWPQNDAAHQPPNNFDEIRNPYKEPSKYKDAEAETLRWCATRVNYLEKQWGNNRPNIKY